MGESTASPHVTENFLTCPKLYSNSGSGERKKAVSGDPLDQLAIRVHHQQDETKHALTFYILR